LFKADTPSASDGMFSAISFAKGTLAMLSPANLPALTSLPAVTNPIRLNDLPELLGPYAVAAPIYVYLMRCGNLTATRFRLKDEEDLILVLKPRHPALSAAA
jgi:hypothetical protein